MAVFGAIVFLTASVLITVESVDPIAHCPDYVTETATLQCQCKAPDRTVPDEGFSVSWPGTNTTSNTLMIANIQRKDNGTRYLCQMVLNGTTTSATYTLQVAYGPANKTTTITSPAAFPTDGSSSVTLTCAAEEVNPTPTYNWTGVNCDNGIQSNTCTFTPIFPRDNGTVVTCMVHNPMISVPSVTNTAWATFTLNIKDVTATTVASTTPARTTAQPTTAPPTPAPSTPPTTKPPTTTASVTNVPVNTTSTAPVTSVLPVTTAPIITAPITSAPVIVTPVTSASIPTAAPVTTAQATTSVSAVTTTAVQGISQKETDTQGFTPGSDNSNTTPSSGTETPTTVGAATHTAPPIGVIVGCSVGAFILILVVFAICCTRRKSKKKHVNLKNAENNKGQTRQAYVNKGYLSLDMTNDSNRSATTKPTNSSPSPTVTGRNNEPKNKMATNKENGTNTEFGYSSLSDNVSHVTTSSETRGDEVTLIENPIFDTYSSLNDTEPPQSNHAVIEFELSSPAGGDDCAEVTKEQTANIDVEEASNAGGTDVYAVVDKTKPREPQEKTSNQVEDQVPEVA